MKPTIDLAAILAGGEARRMGVDKASLNLEGLPLIEHVYARVAPLADRVVTIGGRPGLAHRGAPWVADRYPGTNSMGGLATALAYAAEVVGPGAWILCVACDMPLLDTALLHSLCRRRSNDHRAVVPRARHGFEPLCAVYHTSCLNVLERAMAVGNLAIRSLFQRVPTLVVGQPELRRFDPDLLSFFNVNTPGDMETVRNILRGAA
jgi:molybdopterin-guanine dinucleotide biosynthesis protein A